MRGFILTRRFKVYVENTHFLLNTYSEFLNTRCLGYLNAKLISCLYGLVWYRYSKCDQWIVTSQSEKNLNMQKTMLSTHSMFLQCWKLSLHLYHAFLSPLITPLVHAFVRPIFADLMGGDGERRSYGWRRWGLKADLMSRWHTLICCSWNDSILVWDMISL